MTLEAIFSQMLLPAQRGGRVQAIEILRVNKGIGALINEGKFNQIYLWFYVDFKYLFL